MAEKRKLTVTKCDEAFRGRSKSTGGEYVMYDVLAVDEAGNPITDRLRAFEELPLDVLRDYEVQPYSNDRYGESFTLKLPKAGARLGPKVDELRDRVDELEGRLALVESLIPPDRLEAARAQATPATAEVDTPPSDSPPAGPPAEGPPTF